MRSGSAAGALLDPRGELLHLVVDAPTLGHLLADLLVRVHDRGVVAAAEGLPDLRQRHVGQLAAEVHRDLAGRGERLRLAGAAQVVERHVEELRRDAHDGRRGDLRRVRVRDQVAEHDLRERAVDRLLVQGRERRDADERAFELPDVRLNPRGDEREDVVGEVVGAVEGCFLAEDRDAGLEVWRLDVGDEAPLEPGADALLETELLRRPVRRYAAQRAA